MSKQENQWADTPLELQYNKEPVCPHCNYHIDSTDLFRGRNAGTEEEIDCPSCNKHLLVEANYEVTYTTYKPLEKEDGK